MSKFKPLSMMRAIMKCRSRRVSSDHYDLDGQDCWILAALVLHANDNREDWPTHLKIAVDEKYGEGAVVALSWPGLRTWADDAHVSTTTVKRRLKVYEELGFVTVLRTKRAGCAESEVNGYVVEVGSDRAHQVGSDRAHLEVGSDGAHRGFSASPPWVQPEPTRWVPVGPGSDLSLNCSSNCSESLRAHTRAGAPPSDSQSERPRAKTESRPAAPVTTSAPSSPSQPLTPAERDAATKAEAARRLAVAEEFKRANPAPAKRAAE